MSMEIVIVCLLFGFEYVLVNKVIHAFLSNQLVYRFPCKISKEKLEISSSLFGNVCWEPSIKNV